jgi:hypothetical protein
MYCKAIIGDVCNVSSTLYGVFRKGIILLFIEYQSFCPVVSIGPPPPPRAGAPTLQASVSPPTWTLSTFVS